VTKLFVNENPFAGSQRRAADVDGHRHLRSANTQYHWSFHQLGARYSATGLSRGCGQSMELPSANDHGLTVAAGVPPTT